MFMWIRERDAHISIFFYLTRHFLRKLYENINLTYCVRRLNVMSRYGCLDNMLTLHNLPECDMILQCHHDL